MHSSARACSATTQNKAIIRADDMLTDGYRGAPVSTLPVELGAQCEAAAPSFSAGNNDKPLSNAARRAMYFECARLGMTTEETAEKMGVVIATVHSWACNNRVKFKKPYRPGVRHAEYLACYQAGMTVPQAALQMSVTTSAVYNWARHNKVSFKTPKRIARVNPRHDEYRRCYERGMTARECAAHMGVVTQAAYKWAARQGVKFGHIDEIEAQIAISRTRRSATDAATLVNLSPDELKQYKLMMLELGATGKAALGVITRLRRIRDAANA